MKKIILAVACLVSLASLIQAEESSAMKKIKVTEIHQHQKNEVARELIQKTEEEWEKILTPEEFDVTRKAGTERAFTGRYWDNHDKGIYKCTACGNQLFTSETKFESGTGWPSFWQPIAAENVETKDDFSYFSHRTEVLCPVCHSHLGHVFDDGPKPTGLRYCMNSAALKFEKDSA